MLSTHQYAMSTRNWTWRNNRIQIESRLSLSWCSCNVCTFIHHLFWHSCIYCNVWQS